MASYDWSDYTKSVIDATGPNASPRIKQIMPIMIRKIHEFLIEADITTEEWLAACNLLVQAGQVSSDKRNEVVLVTDVLGIESLVNTLDQTRPARTGAAENKDATQSAILGPFYREGVPVSPNGECIVRQDEPGAPYTFLSGVVYDAEGKPLPNAELDVWHDAPDGLYDAQTPEKPEYHCRGRFRTDAEGRYHCVVLRPTPYPIPYDFSAGTLLKLLDRHPYRPAHIHFWVEAKGHTTLVTQVFDRTSEYLKDDAVFAVKDSNIVDFVPITPETKAKANPEVRDKLKYELVQDFHLQRA